jgi:hypothetical protein
MLSARNCLPEYGRPTVYMAQTIQKTIRRWQGSKSERLDEYMFNEKIPEAMPHNGF